jgi:hypothetical protein
MGKLYSSEKEWLIKDSVLKIPEGSKMYIVEPFMYRDAYDKWHSGDKNVQFFVNKEHVAKFEKWLELVRMLKTKWSIEIVKEKQVEAKKYELIKANREAV